jgi:hypothetical protein
MGRFFFIEKNGFICNIGDKLHLCSFGVPTIVQDGVWIPSLHHTWSFRCVKMTRSKENDWLMLSNHSGQGIYFLGTHNAKANVGGFDLRNCLVLGFCANNENGIMVLIWRVLGWQGSQCVCTNFSIFVCTQCSGVQ